MTSSSGRSTASVARAIAAAVFLPSGSSSTLTPGTWLRASAAYWPAATTVMSDRSSPRSGPSSRATVFWNSVPSANSGRNGLGRSGEDRGHRRVPPPPAMITTYMPGHSRDRTRWEGEPPRRSGTDTGVQLRRRAIVRDMSKR